MLRIVKGGTKSPVRLFLNSKPVPLHSLNVVLRKEFSARPEWDVYVDGSPDLDWGEVAEIIEVVREADGTVIFLPRSSPVQKVSRH